MDKAAIQSTKSAQAKLMRRATAASLAVAGTLVAVKIGAWLATDSVALLGSALDSGLDIVASAINFLAVREALQPPDREHRFGHGKAEAISGLAQGAFISGSAIFLLIQSLGRLLHPQTVDYPLVGIGVSVFALLLTSILVLYQRMVKHRTRSLAISADETHYRSDIILNLGVLAAFALSGPLIDLPFADPVIGALIAVYIAISAFSILRRSYDQLMDREFTDEERAMIARIARENPTVVSMHDLRTRRSGRDAFIQLHLELPPALGLVDAHRVADDVESRIRAAFPEAEVIIHEDPAGYEDPSDLAMAIPKRAG